MPCGLGAILNSFQRSVTDFGDARRSQVENAPALLLTLPDRFGSTRNVANRRVSLWLVNLESSEGFAVKAWLNVAERQSTQARAATLSTRYTPCERGEIHHARDARRATLI